jgi:hypothetical protein
MNFNFRSDVINLCIKIRVMYNLVRGRKASNFLASSTLIWITDVQDLTYTDQANL